MNMKIDVCISAIFSFDVHLVPQNQGSLLLLLLIFCGNHSLSKLAVQV